MVTDHHHHHPQYLLLVDGGALPLRGGGAFLFVLSPAGRSCSSSVVRAGRGGRGRLGTVVVPQLGEPLVTPSTTRQIRTWKSVKLTLHSELLG